MILRILRGRTQADALPRVLDAIRTDVEEWAAIGAGPISFHPAWRPEGDEPEFLLVSTWSDVEAVLARGGDVSQPRGGLAESGSLRDARAEHYELMMGMARTDERLGQVLRLSSIDLIPGRSSAYYDHLRRLWEELVWDAGLISLEVGRRAGPEAEHAIVVSVWETEAALQAATSDGFVGGEAIAGFYASQPTIQQFTPLAVESRPAARA